MTIKAPKSSSAKMVAVVLNKESADDLVLRLYKNDLTPDDDTAIGDFVEVTAAGYAAVDIVAANWDIVPGATSVATYPVVTFTFSVANAGNIYGYYVTEKNSGALKWAERFTNTASLLNLGDKVEVTPKFGVKG